MNQLLHLKNISSVVTLSKADAKDGRNLLPEDCSIEKNISIFCTKNEIIYVGNDKEKIQQLQKSASKTINLKNYSVTPEIVDSHTHLVFGGDRSEEYVKRLNGISYQQIAMDGGGINHTSLYTNKLNFDELLKESIKKIEQINSYGINTIEIKSGYGLNIDKEIELTKIIDNLKKYFYPKIQIINTFMAAHAIPKNYPNSDEYMQKVCIPALLKLSNEKIIDFVDIFHEQNYFSEKNVRELADICHKLGIKMRIHADEFNDNNGAEIAVELKFYSADHLLTVSDSGIEKLAKSKTVATLLPGTGYFLGKNQAPARKLLNAGCKVAIASDFNPGSCHLDNLLFIANLAAPNFGLNIAELWASITLNPAHSLGLLDQGSIIIGKKPRFSFFNTNNINEITYSWMKNFSVRIEEVDQFLFETP